jgi:hypothetical protein
MIASKIFLAAVTTALSASAAMVDTYRDAHCKDFVKTVNVWDNTCATQNNDGFESFKITYSGGWKQKIVAYNTDSCPPHAAVNCVAANEADTCFSAVNGAGSSHALGSWFKSNC